MEKNIKIRFFPSEEEEDEKKDQIKKRRVDEINPVYITETKYQYQNLQYI